MNAKEVFSGDFSVAGSLNSIKDYSQAPNRRGGQRSLLNLITGGSEIPVEFNKRGSWNFRISVNISNE